MLKFSKPERRKLQVTASAAMDSPPASEAPTVDQDSQWPIKMELPEYNSKNQQNELLELVVVGGGPAGLSVAARVSAFGYKVVLVDPEPLGRWPNNYGVWCDEFKAIGLDDCFETVWDSAVVQLDDGDEYTRHLTRPYARVDRPRLKRKLLRQCVDNGVAFLRAKATAVDHGSEVSVLRCSDGAELRAALVVDAAGFSNSLVRFDKAYDPGFQGAYGIMAEVESHPFEVDKMLFMDWRDSHTEGRPAMREGNARLPTFLYAMPFSPTRVFLEETSLVAKPAVGFQDLKDRLEARLEHLGIKVTKVTEEEYCLIPMGGELPVLRQRTLAIGGSAGLVHPSTGYMVARALSTAPIVADAIVDQLDLATGREEGRRKAGSKEEADRMAAAVWDALWPAERLRQREFFWFGQDVLLQLDLEGTREFFDSFFTLRDFFWQGFLSSNLGFLNLIRFGLALFINASTDAKMNILSKGIVGLPIMLLRISNAPFQVKYLR
eukprot:CAMPEP_0177594828 /NCGR_PEP_ID=MMETSP0419_2-20121207/9998_1 /TAXON_ID=582737 /ORGANISM="Tetraselmis sp., Strain GSL018" /LENGTH=491 /DNA_ID=CAMNT_0019086181 /DNA_START=226 /DNA_END=1701 /DNA_ORIENTATION=+